MSHFEDEYLREVRYFIIGILEQGKGKQWTFKEIFKATDKRFGENAVRYALNSLKQDRKIVLRRYKSNLCKYSLS